MDTKSKSRAAIYCRISKDRTGAGLGVERQQVECQELADRLGFKIITVETDNDISAYSGKPRPGYRRLLAAIADGEVDAVIAWHTDRLHRSPTELEDYITACEPRNVATHTVKAGPIDLATPSGRMGARVYGAVARYEVEHNIERITSKKLDDARKGKWSGGGRPYAFEQDGITIRESEAVILRECVARIIAGHSQISIVRWLNQAGHKTVTGKRWMLGNFQRTIVKKRYIGVREHVPEHGGPRGEYPAEWPGIISAEDYELMVARLNDSKQPWNHGMTEGRTYPLSGIARCGVCGAPMYGQRRKLAAGKEQRRYRCKATDNHGMKVGCGKVFRDATALEAYVYWHVLYRLDTPEMAQALVPKASGDKAQQLAQELLKLKRKRKDTAGQLALADGDDELDLRVMLDTIRAKQQAVQSDLNALQRKAKARILPSTGSLRRAFECADITDKRTIIQLVYREVRVMPGHPRSKRWQGYSFDEDTVELIDAISTA